MPGRACRPAGQRAEQSAECEDHQEGRNSEDASAESRPLAGGRIVQCPEVRRVGEDHLRIGRDLAAGEEDQAERHTAVHLAGLEEGTVAVATVAAAAGLAAADLQGRTGEGPAKSMC